MQIHIVFVEPQFTGNIGFLARTMANFGFKNLILVNPPELDEDAYRFSKHARYIIENAEILNNFEELRRSLDYLVATSGVSTKSPKKFKRIALTPREFAQKVWNFSGNIGIVFGRENYGLYNEEIEKCDSLITIPTSEEYPIMNITHAAAIILYEIFMEKREEEGMPLAEEFELNLLNERFSELLGLINFPDHKRKNTEVMFRRIIGRAMLTKWEYHSMMGVMKRIIYAIQAKDDY
ncbi:RNA methyltransferase [Candidatus Aciduliprofundum boonei]|uniref:RNA methyltransferase, TrmH family, group 1 n=1 Tax=Aciduliprofundum boonei (strain DSM 19572 / T469) TaxID=439481 RepID=D3TBC0_ACIB4|nr:RNA methyltransferase [Candidatus Aciduliprofundum boonei]ADD07855.1 RNA methyltransferase, TrmH family, group 1 [Aciduliprofundum boonei T469]HII54959.1 RNA methyltransferase [Candidatus Aciduliprofundum boonei]